MCHLKHSARWFLNNAHVDRQTAEDDEEKQRCSWEDHAIDYVIVQRE